MLKQEEYKAKGWYEPADGSWRLRMQLIKERLTGTPKLLRSPNWKKGSHVIVVNTGLVR